MIWLVAATLLLQPVLDEATELRLVATGTGSEPIEWYANGSRLAVTQSGEAARVPFDAGSHDIWAVTRHDGAWNALVRPDPDSMRGAQIVPSWTAEHPGVPSQFVWWPWLLGATGFALLVLRPRPKRP